MRAFIVDRAPNGEYTRMSAEQKEAWDAKYEPENQAFNSTYELIDEHADEQSQPKLLAWISRWRDWPRIPVSPRADRPEQ